MAVLVLKASDDDARTETTGAEWIEDDDVDEDVDEDDEVGGVDDDVDGRGAAAMPDDVDDDDDDARDKIASCEMTLLPVPSSFSLCTSVRLYKSTGTVG